MSQWKCWCVSPFAWFYFTGKMSSEPKPFNKNPCEGCCRRLQIMWCFFASRERRGCIFLLRYVLLLFRMDQRSFRCLRQSSFLGTFESTKYCFASRREDVHSARCTWVGPRSDCVIPQMDQSSQVVVQHLHFILVPTGVRLLRSHWSKRITLMPRI